MPPDSPDSRPLLARLESRFGELRLVESKPFSLHYRDPANNLLVKVYRVIDVPARQAREIQALDMAPRLGLAVPKVLAHAQLQNVAWTALQVVPGHPLTLNTEADVHRYVATARSAIERLHVQPSPGGAGYGWRGSVMPSTGAFLSSQLSGRVRVLPAWRSFCRWLCTLDEAPAVYLHGDLKPEHLIVGSDGLFLVDWEACARGPAVLDQADIAFRVAREVAYADLQDVSVASFLDASPALVAALAWRLALWLDRRHTSASNTLATTFDTVLTLAEHDTPTRVVETIIKRARAAGTRY